MATIGDKLSKPENGWRRYDDRHDLLMYNSSWRKVAWSGAYNSTSTAALKNTVATLEFSFVGTKVRLIAYRSTTYTYNEDTYVYIDGKYDNLFYGRGTNQHSTIVYEKTGLDYGLHTVKIILPTTPSNASTYNARMDAIDIDSDGELRPLNGTYHYLFSKNNKFYAVIKATSDGIVEVPYTEDMFLKKGLQYLTGDFLRNAKEKLGTFKIVRKKV